MAIPFPTWFPRRQNPSNPFWKWLALVLSTAVFGIGCSPLNMCYFLLPWMEDKGPPKVNLTSTKKEPTLVVMASFAQPLESHLELQTVDRDLADRLGQAIKKRFEGNREKVKIIPTYQVKSFLNKHGDSSLVSVHEVGRHFQADYVINLEINALSFYENSYRQLFRGKTEIAVAVFDMDKPRGEGPVYEGVYQTEYPTSGPIDAGGSSVLQFRTLFLTRIARDLSKWFAAYPAEERREFD